MSKPQLYYIRCVRRFVLIIFPEAQVISSLDGIVPIPFRRTKISDCAIWIKGRFLRFANI